MSFTLDEFADALMDAVNKNRAAYSKEQLASYQERATTGGLSVWEEKRGEPRPLKLYTRTEDGDFWSAAINMLHGTDPVILDGIGTVTLAEAFGGEGEGSQYFLVMKVAAEDGSVRYIKRDGWYASHDGGYLDGPHYFVTPIVKTITVFEPEGTQ